MQPTSDRRDATPVLTGTQLREIDRRAIVEYGLPGVVLMENAGRGVADCLMQNGVKGPVVICCGKGNNGGDGFVIARWLELKGIPVRVVLFADRNLLVGDALIHCQVAERAGLSIVSAGCPPFTPDLLAGAEWVVDALLGTGLTGPVDETFAAAINKINAAAAKVLSVDLPSGMDCETGQILGAAVRADLTATMVAWKTGFQQSRARSFLGEVEVVDIGVPRRLLEEYLTKPGTRLVPQ